MTNYKHANLTILARLRQTLFPT